MHTTYASELTISFNNRGISSESGVDRVAPDVKLTRTWESDAWSSRDSLALLTRTLALPLFLSPTPSESLIVG